MSCLTACGGGDSDGDPVNAGGVAGAIGSGGAAGGSGAGGSAGSAAGGSGGSLQSGCGSTTSPATGKLTLDVAGTQRTYYLHLPPSYDASKPWPLVLNFHGRTASVLGEASLLQENVSHMNAKGDAAGFIVANPQGITDSDGSQTWNAGVCCAEDKSRDDVGFVDALLAELESQLCIDSKRIYSTGLSNGGFFSHRLACERADRFAAVAPVAAFNGMTPCTPSRPVPVMAFNGTSDSLVSYTLAKTSAEAWAARNGCNATPTETFNNGDSHCDTYSGCQGGADVVFCTVDDGGHTWPGGLDLSGFGFGKTTQDINANDAMWDFFGQHALP